MEQFEKGEILIYEQQYGTKKIKTQKVEFVRTTSLWHRIKEIRVFYAFVKFKHLKSPKRVYFSELKRIGE